MRRVLFLFGVAALLAGCGGGGDNNPSPFEGSWVGTIFADGDPGETMRLTISRDGNITGSETVGSATAADTGHVDNNGRFDITSRLAGTQDVFYHGTMNFNFNGHLIGNGTGTQGGTTVNMNFDLRPQF